MPFIAQRWGCVCLCLASPCDSRVEDGRWVCPQDPPQAEW